MKVAAIIAEYNPFHKGHAYHIDKTREITGADYIVAVMSGNFVQRGAPAIVNKYKRTEMALLSGADAVLELPLPYAVSSAEYFAGGGVTLLHKLNCIDYLSFGSECGDIELLSGLADILLQEPTTYKEVLSNCLKEGRSYPVARIAALKAALTGTDDSLNKVSLNNADEDAIGELLSNPNNILALEYLKSLKQLNSSIRPVTVKRCGNYHDTELTAFSSATAIRNALFENTADITSFLPEGSALILSNENTHGFQDCNDFSLLLYYKLLSEKEKGFSDYLDCNREISDKICKNLSKFKDFSSFCDLLKSKNLTYTRISRVLLHILLNIKTPNCFPAPVCERSLLMPYARLLGFRKQSAPFMNLLKKQSQIPLISNLPGALELLDEEGACMLQQTIDASLLYEAVYSSKCGFTNPNEYLRSPIIL